MPSSRYAEHGVWDNWPDRIDEDDLVQYISRELRTRDIYLSEADMKQALGDLKDILRTGERHGLDYGRADQVVNLLRKKMDRDLEDDGDQGLRRSRSRFLTLCFVARRLRNKELAQALLRFFTTGQDDIIATEETFLLTEWCIGLQQLEDLVPQDRLDEAFLKVARLGPPMFEQWRRSGPEAPHLAGLIRYIERLSDRERDQLQLSTPRDLPPRRLSVPGVRRPFMIDMPSRSRTGYNTPLLSPSISQEMYTLYWQHQVQALELHRLRRDFDIMWYRR